MIQIKGFVAGQGVDISISINAASFESHLQALHNVRLRNAPWLAESIMQQLPLVIAAVNKEMPAMLKAVVDTVEETMPFHARLYVKLAKRVEKLGRSWLKLCDKLFEES